MAHTAVPQNLELTDILPSGKKENHHEEKGPRNNGPKMDREVLEEGKVCFFVALQE